MKTDKIWIRADANSEIGSGHMMRCLSVAEELEKRGAPVLFVAADEASAKLLEQKGQEHIVLHSDYKDMEAELPKLCALLAKEQPQMLLTDSYFVTKNYLEQVGNYTKTAYIDDLFAFSYPVDVVINYNIYGDLLPYREQAASRAEKFLLGLAYAPLREEFKQISYEVKEEVKNVLITTGGSDTYNLAGQILKTMLADERTKHFNYYVVSGVFNSHLPQLKRVEEEYPNVHIRQNVTYMSELMAQCDIAITAAGSTMYELCAVGVPMLCFSFAENQERPVRTFADRNLVHFGGEYRQLGEGMFTILKEKLSQLASAYGLRKSYSMRERSLVDGNGAARIAEVLMQMI